MLSLLLLGLPSLAIAQTVTVNADTTYQTIDGFGFSEAFWFSLGIQELPEPQQAQAFDYLFNKTAGAAFNIIRNRIPSESADSILPTAPATNASAPTYVTLPYHDEEQLWFSLYAQANYSINTFYADAWSAPSFMKTNDDDEDGGYLCGVTGETCSTGDWRTAYANYLVEYITQYQADGIEINYIGFLNEPEFVATSYSSMLSDGTQAASFIPYLYDAIQAAGLSTGITCCDAEGWDDQVTYTAQIQAAGVESMLARITSHSYTSSPTSPIDTTLPVWQTEYCDLDGTDITAWYSDGAMGEGLTWANYIYTGLVDANLSAYFYWIGILSGESDGGLIGIDSNNDLVITGRLWAFGQWARYVQPGAVRVATTSSISTSLTSAFKNTDGTLSVQVINNSGTTETVTISVTGYTVETVEAWLTDESNNAIVATTATVSGGVVTGSSPGYSMVTFVLSSSGSTTSSTSSSTSSTSTTTTTTSNSSTATTTTTTTSNSSTTTTTTTTTSASSCQTLYGQCGGTGWTGATCCVSPATCVYSNPYYSQCLDS